jgi:hypothetical protein
MSPRSAPRRPRDDRSRRRQERHEPIVGGSAQEAANRELFRMSRGLAQNPDPLMAELIASTIVGLLAQPLLDVADPVEHLGRPFVAFAEGRRTPDALALLTGLSVVAPPSLAEEAAAAAARLRETIADPAWARQPLPRAHVTSAWVSSDEFGDQDLVVGVTAREGWPDHALVVMIDHNLGRLAKVVSVVPDAERVRREWTQATGYAATPLSIQAFVDRATSGLDLADLSEHRTFEEDDPDARALIRARLRDLPPANPVEETDLTDEEAEALLLAFEASPHGAPLGDDVELAFHLLQHALDTRGDPLRWSPIVAEWCLLEWMPSEANLDPADADRMLTVVRAWVRWAGEQRGLTGDDIAETLHAVDELAAPFREALGDRDRWGPAKAIAQQMLIEGVALDDPAAVNAWMADFNARPQAERDLVFEGIEELLPPDADPDR